jgi:hypothetical protein
LEACLGEGFGPGSQRVHTAQARRPRRDAHGRGRPSEDVLFSVASRHPAVILALARRTWRQHEFCGVRWHHRDLREMTVVTWLPRSVECAVPGIWQARGVV